HVKLLGELDRAAVHHTCTEARQLEHFVVTDLLDAPRFGQLPRISGVNAVDVGVDFTGVGLEHGSQRDGGGVAAAAAQRSDVEIFVDALKTGGDDDVPFVETLTQAVGR